MNNPYLTTLLSQREQCIQGIRHGGINTPDQYRVALKLIRRLIHQQITAIRREERSHVQR